MAAETDDLPNRVRFEIGLFSDVNMVWLAEILTEGDPTIEQVSAIRRARTIFAAVSGAQQVARGRGDLSFYDDIIEGYREIGLFRVGPGAPSRPDDVPPPRWLTSGRSDGGLAGAPGGDEDR